MSLENDSNPQPPKKKTSKALIVILILVGLFVLSIPVLGIFVAIAIPALAAAKADAQTVIAQNIVNGTQTAITRFETKNGKSPQSWEEIGYYLKMKGKKANSKDEILEMARMPEGTKFEIEGINGAEKTYIEFPNGRVISPKN